MRTPDVEKAMRNTESGLYCTDDAEILAAEIERLEKRLDHSHEVWRNEHDRAKAVETRYAASQDALTEAMGELTEARDRVAELEHQMKHHLCVAQYHIEELEAQNARLRAALDGARHAIATARAYMREPEPFITDTAVRDGLRIGIKRVEDGWAEADKAALTETGEGK